MHMNKPRTRHWASFAAAILLLAALAPGLSRYFSVLEGRPTGFALLCSGQSPAQLLDSSPDLQMSAFDCDACLIPLRDLLPEPASLAPALYLRSDLREAYGQARHPEPRGTSARLAPPPRGPPAFA